ncbi:hypothetical protein [Paenibacillus aceris]|uniref:Uncharacterized protein n=1 Tax=Paenibacillus aceris TaxID=869555 RepID=A0ABS4I1T2_9BACL|nr:hypothetical protein [Paenibacillus aceris]MBP1964877.1 hypothetical protein [Paenibacillus aceris]NHW38122.1 hypothetical protein [Paenibacillus aceris]
MTAKILGLPGDTRKYLAEPIIEIYIGGKAKKNAREFAFLAINFALAGVNRNNTIIFYTWHISDIQAHRFFGNSVITKKRSKILVNNIN